MQASRSTFGLIISCKIRSVLTFKLRWKAVSPVCPLLMPMQFSDHHAHFPAASPILQYCGSYRHSPLHGPIHILLLFTAGYGIYLYVGWIPILLAPAIATTMLSVLWLVNAVLPILPHPATALSCTWLTCAWARSVRWWTAIVRAASAVASPSRSVTSAWLSITWSAAVHFAMSSGCYNASRLWQSFIWNNKFSLQESFLRHEHVRINFHGREFETN